MRQLTAVSPIGLDPVAVFLRHQTGRSDQARNTLSHQAVMKAEAKISGFIDHLQVMSSIASQNAL
jgi:primosomal replication protein N